MRFYQDTLEVKTGKYFQYINITDRVQAIVGKSKIKDGMVFINSPHNTAAVVIQENDSSIHEDTEEILEKLTPLNRRYHHGYEGPENATAHIRSNLFGSSITVPLKNGNLVLGTWQNLFFIELFESRNRKVIVTVIGE